MSSNMMPIMIPRPTSMFSQHPYSLGMQYPSTIVYPTTGQLYPSVHALPPPLPSQTVAHQKFNLWNRAAPYSQVNSSSPPLPHPPAKLSPHSQPSSSSMSLISPLRSMSHCSSSPSPPSSPASTGSSGEKMSFSIDAILSSKPRSPTSSQAGSPRAAFFSDRRLTPSPESLSPATLRCAPIGSADGLGGIDAGIEGRRDVTTCKTTSGARNLSEKSLKRSQCDSDESMHEWGAGAGSRAKRVRTIFTQEQLDRLELEFDRQQYMVGTERLFLAAELSLSESQVKVWFQNRRIKWRKQNFEKQQAKIPSRLHSGLDSSSDTEDEDRQRLADEKSEDVVAAATAVALSSPVDSSRVLPDPSSANTGLDVHALTHGVSARQRYDNELTAQTTTTTEDDSKSGGRGSSSAPMSPTSLESEMKRVEERLAMRLCRRSLMQSASSSMKLLPASSSNLRLISSVRRLESTHDVDFLTKQQRE